MGLCLNQIISQLTEQSDSVN